MRGGGTGQRRKSGAASGRRAERIAIRRDRAGVCAGAAVASDARKTQPQGRAGQGSSRAAKRAEQTYTPTLLHVYISTCYHRESLSRAEFSSRERCCNETMSKTSARRALLELRLTAGLLCTAFLCFGQQVTLPQCPQFSGTPQVSASCISDVTDIVFDATGTAWIADNSYKGPGRILRLPGVRVATGAKFQSNGGLGSG